MAVRDPGDILFLRWLRKANRIQRLYICEGSPPSELQKLILFILKSYTPMWFTIKTSKHFTNLLPKFVYQAIQSTRYLSKSLLDVVDPVIELNVFFFRPPRILTVSQDSRKQDKHEISRTSKNSESNVDRCILENSEHSDDRKSISMQKNTQKWSTE